MSEVADQSQLRPHVGEMPDDLAARVATLLGRHRSLESRRLEGGAKKAVYLAQSEADSRFVVYAWDPDANYLPDTVGIGATQLELSTRKLEGLGVRVARILGLDASGSDYPFDVAVVEFIDGVPIEDLWQQDHVAGELAYRRLGLMLRRMHDDRRAEPGPLEPVPLRAEESCESQAMSRALADLDRATGGVSALARHRSRLAELLEKRRERITPRQEHGLIHGEVIGDHILVGSDCEPVLIDTEQIRYFDIEWEHAFLQILQEPHYTHLRREDFDPDRIAFYKLCLHLSYVAGPLTLLDNGHPAREFIEGIINAHVLALLKLAKPSLVL